MEFDFLPNLPKSNLDDRTFDDLVEECLLRIPRYCPEWTNYNPSDPGITLIELFAWLTDQMLMRFNQVPRRNYVAFLELLGIQLQPPVAAQAEVTFYLSAPVSEAYTIPARTEVATPRTETEEAVVFSTDGPLVIDLPEIRHCLSADVVEERPRQLRDRWGDFWTQEPDRAWSGPELTLFSDPPQAGNCFYLVFDGDRAIEGNVLALAIRGAVATTTGIDPQAPPRFWEAWDGERWQPVLLSEADDLTDGFSFRQVTRQGGTPLQGADAILHLPRLWPATQFAGYHGRWVRCTCRNPGGSIGSLGAASTAIAPPNRYLRAPRIVGISARAIGGTAAVTQSREIRGEILGTSNGRAGQTFQLQNAPVLPRTSEEYLLVTPPDELPQRWQEVSDFSESGPGDLHFTLDALTGVIRFGPLILESSGLQAETRWRTLGQRSQLPATETRERPGSERQYGAIPPKGAAIEMVAYRTGGGRVGNVQPTAISVIKTAVPFVARLTNHRGAFNGADAESLEEAAIRVPQWLRSRDRAVTKEDFEALALAGSGGALARTYCLPTKAEVASPWGAADLLRDLERESQARNVGADGTYAVSGPLIDRVKTYLEREGGPEERAGRVRLLLVPHPPKDAPPMDTWGLAPEMLALNPALLERVRAYLDERRLLGVEVLFDRPEYVGVSVRAEIALDPTYDRPDGRAEIRGRIAAALYRFLNPMTGWVTGSGWPFGRPVRVPDIIPLLQGIKGVSYLGAVQLFALRQSGDAWHKTLALDARVDPGPLGLISSWRDDASGFGHEIDFLGGG